MTDIQVHNLVRGMHGPYPAAYSFLENVIVEIDQTHLLEETLTGKPGSIGIHPDFGVIVFANDRGLVVENITVDGKAAKPETILKSGCELVFIASEEG
jgi:methionyl-tRNA formyltransferase